jgi:hypothetical protein
MSVRGHSALGPRSEIARSDANADPPTTVDRNVVDPAPFCQIDNHC